MDVLTDEIERALAAGLYYLAILGALALPDICAALESANGRTTSTKYMAWCDTWLIPSYPQLNSQDLYSMRCGVLHQGRLGHPRSQYARILFTLPNVSNNVFHQNIINDALNLDAVTFCRDMNSAVARWYTAQQHDSHVLANLPQLIQYRAQGLAPYMVGMPLIS